MHRGRARQLMGAFMIVFVAAACTPMSGPKTAAVPSTNGSGESEPRYIQAQGNSASTSAIAAARAAWRTQVRDLCGSREHDEDMVYEYTYEVIATDPRDRVIGIREGYVRCKDRAR